MIRRVAAPGLLACVGLAPRLPDVRLALRDVQRVPGVRRALRLRDVQQVPGVRRTLWLLGAPGAHRMPGACRALRLSGVRRAVAALGWVVAMQLMVALGSPARAADRVVSLNLCTDQLLVLLAPGKVAGLSSLSRDPTLSFVSAEAARLPVVRASAEAVLRLHPDLVLGTRWGAQTTLAVLEAEGIPVLRLDLPADFPGIARQTRDLATVLGVPERGEALVRDMQATLDGVAHLPAFTHRPASAEAARPAPGSGSGLSPFTPAERDGNASADGPGVPRLASIEGGGSPAAGGSGVGPSAPAERDGYASADGPGVPRLASIEGGGSLAASGSGVDPSAPAERAGLAETSRVPARPATVVAWAPRGYTAGPGTLVDAVITAAGRRNMGEGGRIGLEALLRRRPDLLLVPTLAAYPSLATDLLRNPALRFIPRREVPPALTICAGPFSAGAVPLVAR